MARLTDFEKRIRALEADGVSKDAEAVGRLMDEIVKADWQTHKERQAAQRLVARLERIRWQLQDGSASRTPPSAGGRTSPPDDPALSGRGPGPAQQSVPLPA